MRRRVLFGLTLGLLVLTGCQADLLPASKGYVDDRIADVDEKVIASFDAMDRAVLEAKANGQEDGAAAVAGIRAGTKTSKEDLPQRDDALGLWLAGLGGVLVSLYRVLVGRWPMLGGFIELFKGVAPAQVQRKESKRVETPPQLADKP